MISPGIRDLKHNLSRYAALVAAGVIRPASDRGDPLAAGTVTTLIDEDRGDR
jgi:hypothetical protein